MNKYKILLLESSKNDLENIVDYLSKFYPSTALKKYDKLINNISLLQDNPMMFNIYEVHNSPLIFRKMIVDEYLVFYVVDDINKQVIIHTIINGKMDFSNRIN